MFGTQTLAAYVFDVLVQAGIKPAAARFVIMMVTHVGVNCERAPSTRD